MSTYTEQEVQAYVKRLPIGYGTDGLNRHAAINHLLTDRVAAAIREHVEHNALPDYVDHYTTELIEQWKAIAP